MKRLFRSLPRLVRFVLVVTAINLAIFSLLRAAFWVAFQGAALPAAPTDVARAFYLGFKFDLRLALLISLPVLILGALPPLRHDRRPRLRILWAGYFTAALTFLLFLYFADFGHYAYVRMRLNASVIEHLQPLSIALQMAWETYPVMPALLALVLFAGGYGLVLTRTAFREIEVATVPMPAWQRRSVVAAAVFAGMLGIYGKWSWYPLRWSDAYFSGDGFVAALGLNPVLFLTETVGTSAAPYDRAKVERYYDFVAQRLEVSKRDPRSLSFAREVVPPARRGAPLNLVVIHLESFAAFKTGVFGNMLAPTPNFDAIAREGVLFTNFFVPAVPTARSIFNWLTGIPDYNPGQAAASNPLVVDQHTLVNALKGRERFYFIGGSATWGNIRGILSHNIPGLKIFEEGSYDAERPDAWGVSDLVVFEKAHEVLNATDKPFFAFIQTAGNHRPYTLPKELRGFEPATLDDKTLHANGFDGLAAYNGLRFFDHALGYFMRLARTSSYFRNTVFVMYGDHGNPSAVETPWERLRLTGIHVPFVIFAPGIVRGGRTLNIAASEVDLLPTALSAMGEPYLNTTLGRDLFVERPRQEHFALTINGILDDEYLLEPSPRGGYRLYPYRSADPTRDVSKDYPEKVTELLTLREALAETARYLLYHNPPQPHPAAKSP